MNCSMMALLHRTSTEEFLEHCLCHCRAHWVRFGNAAQLQLIFRPQRLKQLQRRPR